MENTQRELLAERRALAGGRIADMLQERTVPAPFDSYFRDMAAGLLPFSGTGNSAAAAGAGKGAAPAAGAVKTKAAWTDPVYTCRKLGTAHGRALCFLAESLGALAGWCAEGDANPDAAEAVTAHLELFLEIYGAYGQDTLPDPARVRETIYWFISDYQDLFAAARVRRVLGLTPDPCAQAALKAAGQGDKDTGFLHLYGEAVSPQQEALAARLAACPESRILAEAQQAAVAFAVEAGAGKAEEKARTVGIDYPLGAERLAGAAADALAGLGFTPVFCRRPLQIANRNVICQRGYYGALPSPEHAAAHAQDEAFYLDARFVRRRLEVLETELLACGEEAAEYAGTLVLGVPEIPAPGPVFSGAVISGDAEKKRTPWELPPAPAEAIRYDERTLHLARRLRAGERALMEEYAPGLTLRVDFAV